MRRLRSLGHSLATAVFVALRRQGFVLVLGDPEAHIRNLIRYCCLVLSLASRFCLRVVLRVFSHVLSLSLGLHVVVIDTESEFRGRGVVVNKPFPLPRVLLPRTLDLAVVFLVVNGVVVGLTREAQLVVRLLQVGLEGGLEVHFLGGVVPVVLALEVREGDSEVRLMTVFPSFIIRVILLNY